MPDGLAAAKAGEAADQQAGPEGLRASGSPQLPLPAGASKGMAWGTRQCRGEGGSAHEDDVAGEEGVQGWGPARVPAGARIAGARCAEAADKPPSAPPPSQSAAVQELLLQSQHQRESELAQELAQPRWQRRQQQQSLQEHDTSGSTPPGQGPPDFLGSQAGWAKPPPHAAVAQAVVRADRAETSREAVPDEGRATPSAPKWIAPSRSAIEASFLTRLERAAFAQR